MPNKTKNNKTKKNNNNKINNKLKNLNSKINRLRINNNKRNKNRMPAANTKNMNRDFRILYQDGNTVRVTGRDLVYQIPSDITSRYNSDIITVIPANPCYWLGTRIAALAQGYQNYRPLNMKFNYIPQCAVTQQGNVIAGTLWNQAPSNVNLQQSLRTSNGGQLSQCYKPFTSIVRMKSNLQYNLYKTAGTFNQESNPFIYIAMAVGCLNEQKQNIIPGYFYVTWSFVLKNPIGNTNIFYNSGLSLYQDTNDDYDNNTMIFLNANESELPRGAILQMDKDTEGDTVATYNGSYYDLQDDDLIWQFANSTIQTSVIPQPTVPLRVYYDTVYNPPHPSTDIQAKFVFQRPEFDESLMLSQLYVENSAPVRLTRNVTYYVLSSENQFLSTQDPFTGWYMGADNTGEHPYIIGSCQWDIIELVDINDQSKRITINRKRKPKTNYTFEHICKYLKGEDIKIQPFKLEEDEIMPVIPETLLQQHTRIKAKSVPKKVKQFTNIIEESEDDY